MGSLERAALAAAERLLAEKQSARVGSEAREGISSAVHAVIEAQRRLAASEGEPYAEVIDPGVDWGLPPIPRVLYDSATVSLVCEKMPDGDDAAREASFDFPRPLVRFSFDLCSSFRCGPPGETRLHTHPLSKRGLMHDSLHIVHNSQWSKEVQSIISAAPWGRGKPRTSSISNKHYIFTFQDKIFEVLAPSMRIEVVTGVSRPTLSVTTHRVVGDW
jgi:hypothetical protein